MPSYISVQVKECERRCPETSVVAGRPITPGGWKVLLLLYEECIRGMALGLNENKRTFGVPTHDYDLNEKAKQEGDGDDDEGGGMKEVRVDQRV